MSNTTSMRRNAVAFAVATALSGGLNTAIAQDGDEPIEEIMVTAAKREQSIQDLSMAVTALGEEDLRLGGIEDITRLEHLVPGMRMGQSGNEARIAMRGTRQNNVGSEAEQVVGIFEDGVYVPTTTQAFGAYIDVSRIEVLRGPQGTLYGRNTFGGTINIITNEPEFDAVTGKVEALYGDYDRARIEGVVNVPFSENFAVRVAAAIDDHDGYIENYFEPGTSDDLSDRDMTFVRFSARWAPTDALDVTLRHTASDLKSNGNAIWGYQIIGGYRDGVYEAGHGFAPADASSDFDRGPWSVSRNLKSNSDHKSNATTLTANYDFGPATLTVVGNYTDFEGEQNSDFDYTDGGDATNNGFTGWQSVQDTYSIETRLTSNGEGSFDWMIGHYYYEQESAWTWMVFEDGAPVIPHWAAQSPYLSDSNGVFANATFPVSDRVRLIAGLRWQEDTKQERDSLDWSVFPPVNADGTGREKSWDDILYRAGVEYDVSGRTMAYGTVSTGYRAGGFNALNPAIPESFDPEEVTAFEAGLKTTIGDSAQLNVSAYYNDYTNMQAQSFIDLGGAAVTEFTENGGEITAMGIEAELRWAPTAEWDIAASLALMDAEFGTYNVSKLNGLGDAGGRQDLNDPTSLLSLKGWSPALAPDVSLGAQIGYVFELAGGSTIRPFLQTTYTSKYYASDVNVPGTEQDAHTKSDLRLIWTNAEGNLQIQGYMLNVEDEAVIQRIAIFNPSGTTNYTGLQTHWNNPRTWGISGTYYFD